jgi:hypothetical protein
VSTTPHIITMSTLIFTTIFLILPTMKEFGLTFTSVIKDLH